MANILVTGGAGFIGSHLATRFVETGHRVRILDDFSTGTRANLEHISNGVEVHEGTLVNMSDCDRACQDIEFVFHEAAVPSVPKSIDEPEASHTANINGTFNLLMAAHRQKVRRLIYAGSSSAYGDVDVAAKHEGISPDPLSPYAVQKLTGEFYASTFWRCFGLETITIRYFNVFGPRQDPASAYAAAIPAFVTQILKGQPPTVYGDGEQTRDFTYIDNVVDANVLAMEMKQAQGEVVNAACGGHVTVNEVIRAINALLGTSVEARHVDPRAGDIRDSCADISRAREVLGYQPKVSFEEGLRRTIDYYRSLS